MSRYSDDAELAAELADAADAITVERFRTQNLQVTAKPDRTPVTDADTDVEDAIRRVLAGRRPGDGVAGEERGGSIAAPGRVWVLDPIDGTKNFLRGVPIWATLIALLDGGVPVVGMITAPLLGRRWWASQGGGAWLRDSAGERQLAVSRVPQLADAYVSTTDLNNWAEHRTQEAYLSLTRACWETRAFGDFWQHCLVAEGALEIAAEPVVNPWDVAAAQVLVTEAGGRFTDLDGAARFDRGSALSTNGLVHDAALAHLRRR
ncbi:histidinol-phosphatase [Prauserella alba]|uniref:Histidinol-phosphatase n=1 Tax=Prauserella alba TaxID=176898 RepID=A0ABP4GD87_9PSEU|nr:histidinol-phosphatase [Prauserella alba]MCP2183707.1 histidinol-phosphate phosphatase (EC 3.1.3.15) [Prauserella alba]